MVSLPRLQRTIEISENDGKPTFWFHRWWDEMAGKIEQAFADIESTVSDLAATQADLATAQAGLATAQADIAAAQADIISTQNDLTAAIRDIARLSSYTAPTNVLSASDAGTDATITIAGHTRVYPGAFVNDVTVSGGTLTGKAFSTTYYVYYDDATLADTTPTYVATTVIADAQVGAGTSRHFVGVVTTPADGGGGTSGGGGYPPGGGGGLIP
jgi:hypothetical protein